MTDRPKLVDVMVVVGACGPERHSYAQAVALRAGRQMLDAHRVAADPDATLRAVEAAALQAGDPGLVLEMPLHAAMMDVIGEFADPTGDTQLSEIICVVDVVHLLDDLHGEDYVVTAQQNRWDGRIGIERSTFIARAQLIVAQIEYASRVVLVNWSSVSRERLQVLAALIGHLAPTAAIVLHERPELTSATVEGPYAQEQTRPGWVALLNGDFLPSLDHPAVSALRYEQPRAFHPARLKRLLDERVEKGVFGRLVRSNGFCRLSTRPHVTAHWEQVGEFISLMPLSFDHQISDPDEVLAFGQDLVFIGLDLDHEAFLRALDDAVLSDHELAAGPSLWSTFTDPFPGWTLSHD